MKDMVQTYLRQIDKLLEDKSAADWDTEIRRHLVKIRFFAHERLIHLIVTVLFALMTLGTVLYGVACPSIGIFILMVLLLALTVPYIRHYYFLENAVQRMFRQYDAMLLRADEKKDEIEDITSSF